MTKEPCLLVFDPEDRLFYWEHRMRVPVAPEDAPLLEQILTCREDAEPLSTLLHLGRRTTDYGTHRTYCELNHGQGNRSILLMLVADYARFSCSADWAWSQFGDASAPDTLRYAPANYLAYREVRNAMTAEFGLSEIPTARYPTDSLPFYLPATQLLSPYLAIFYALVTSTGQVVKLGYQWYDTRLGKTCAPVTANVYAQGGLCWGPRPPQMPSLTGSDTLSEYIERAWDLWNIAPANTDLLNAEAFVRDPALAGLYAFDASGKSCVRPRADTAAPVALRESAADLAISARALCAAGGLFVQAMKEE